MKSEGKRLMKAQGRSADQTSVGRNLEEEEEEMRTTAELGNSGSRIERNSKKVRLRKLFCSLRFRERVSLRNLCLKL